MVYANFCVQIIMDTRHHALLRNKQILKSFLGRGNFILCLEMTRVMWRLTIIYLFGKKSFLVFFLFVYFDIVNFEVVSWTKLPALYYFSVWFVLTGTDDLSSFFFVKKNVSVEISFGIRVCIVSISFF